MRDAVLVVGGGLLQVLAVAAAHDLGLAVAMTDADAEAPAMRLADLPVVADIYDVEAHLRLVDEIGRRMRLRGVFAEGADVEVTVAAAAARAGLPGIPLEAARNTKSKVRMRACFERAGLPNPPWAEVGAADAARCAAARIGYPLVAKAVDNAASRGTTRVDGPAELADAVEHARAHSSTRTALLEGCFGGEEQSVELLFDADGRCHRLNVVDRPFSRDGGHAIELGHVNPSGRAHAERDALFALAERAAAATGVRFGAFKADTIWTADGPRILEVTARLSGGFDCQYTTPLSTGRNFIRAAMRLAVGMPLDAADLRHRWYRHAAAWVAFPPPGRVTRIDGVADALELPGVAHVFLRVDVGDVIRPYHDCAARPAFVVASGETRAEALARAQAGVAALRIETEG
jgi:biotin carboxylase